MGKNQKDIEVQKDLKEPKKAKKKAISKVKETAKESDRASSRPKRQSAKIAKIRSEVQAHQEMLEKEQEQLFKDEAHQQHEGKQSDFQFGLEAPSDNNSSYQPSVTSVVKQPDSTSRKSPALTEPLNEDACIRYLTQHINAGEFSQSLKDAYTNFVNSSYQNAEQEAKIVLRQEFLKGVVLDDFKRYVTREITEKTESLKWLSPADMVYLCFDEINKGDSLVITHEYNLATVLFQEMSLTDGQLMKLGQPNEKIVQFVRQRIELTRAANPSIGLVTFLIACDQLYYYVQILLEDNQLQLDEKKFLNQNYLQQPSRYRHKINAQYILGYCIAQYFPFISKRNVYDLLGARGQYFDNGVLNTVNQSFPAIQEKLVHVITKHVHFENMTIKGAIHRIKSLFELRPSMLDFCKGDICQRAGFLSADPLHQVYYQLAYSPELELKFDNNSLLQIYSTLQKTLASRTKHGMNSKELTDYVDVLRGHFAADGFNHQFTEMEKHSQQLRVKPQSTYEHSQYQTALATFAAMKYPSSSVICAASGMGKTNSILMLCRRMVALGNKVTVVLANEVLLDQFNLDYDIYLDDLQDEISVKLASRITPANCRDRVVIWDEIDEVIDKFPFLFFETTDKKNFVVGGLASTSQAKCSIFLSATVEPYHDKFMKQVLKVKAENIYRFKGASELYNLTSAGGPQQANFEVYVDMDGVQKHFQAEVMPNLGRKPIICFVEVQDEKFTAFLRECAAQHRVSFYDVFDRQAATLVRSMMKKSTSGIVQISPEFARGYDLKLADEAFVVVVANGKSFKISDVQQMLGRGSRSQSQAKGLLLIIASQLHNKVEAYDEIANRLSVKKSIGFPNLAKLYASAKPIAVKSLEAFQKAFSKDQWNVDIDDFIQDFPEVQKQLASVTDQKERQSN